MKKTKKPKSSKKAIVKPVKVQKYLSLDNAMRELNDILGGK